MTEKLLKQMISIVDSTMESYKSDFYTHDLRTLAPLEENVKFLWLCDKSHTALAIIDQAYLSAELMKNEGERFYAMKDRDNLLGSVIYWMKSKDVMCCYFDGEHLNTGININYVYDIWNPIFEALKHEVKKNFPDEWEYYHKGQRIEFTSSVIRSDFLNVLRNADNPSSLITVAEALRYYARRAVNERMVIGFDFADKCFSFYHERNGEVIFNGGIIYYKATEDAPEHWQIHT